MTSANRAENESHVLSLGTYKNVRNTLGMEDDEPMDKFELRKLTDAESKSIFQGAGSLHKGCQHEACQQKRKGDCSNVTCGAHCGDGYLSCYPHSYEGFGGGGEPKYTPKIPYSHPELVAMSRTKK